MRTRELTWSAALVCAASLSFFGCAQKAANTTMQPTGPLPGVTMQQPGNAMPAPTGMAGMGAAAMQPGAQPSTQPSPMSGGSPASKPSKPAADPPAPKVDPCTGFVVSRSKPCNDDPNPCNIDSGYDGDEFCMPPPPDGKGVQVHFGPSSYTDKAETAKYELQPGEEFNEYALANVPLTTDKYFSRVVYQMRPGSHHLINTLVDGQPTPGFQGPAGCPGTQVGSLGGTQNLIYDSRPNGIVPPENEGLGYPLPGNSSICFNYHRYNITDKAQLSEIWVNFYFIDEADVTQKASWGAIIGGLGLNIPPGSMQELHYEFTFSGIDETSTNPARIIQLFGHRHAATDRFAAWLNDTLIYDSWSWRDAVAFNYDSLTQNPEPNPAKMVDGAVNGILKVKNGDVLKYTCFVHNQTQNTLVFANELYTGEMCNLFGQAVGTRFFGSNF